MSWSARGYAPFDTSPANDAVLDGILAQARRCEPGAVALFDLDGCLFDTRYRQVRLLRELASEQGWWELYSVQVEHITDRHLRHTLRDAGLSEERIGQVHATIVDRYRRRFLRYVRHDHAMPGAADLVRAVAQAGVRVAYFTARTTSMREHTLEMLDRYGFPEGPVVDKPAGTEHDEAFKARAVGSLGELGRPVLYLDNEPANCHRFAEAWPHALVVFVETDCSSPGPPREGIPLLRAFLRT